MDDKYFWAPPRGRLTVSLSSQEAADGAYVGLVKIAEQHYYPGKKPIPLEEFQLLSFAKEIVASGWVQIKDDGVHFIDSEKQFSWRFDRKKGGETTGKAQAAKGARDGTGRFKKGKGKAPGKVHAEHGDSAEQPGFSLDQQGPSSVHAEHGGSQAETKHIHASYSPSPSGLKIEKNLLPPARTIRPISFGDNSPSGLENSGSGSPSASASGSNGDKGSPRGSGPDRDGSDGPTAAGDIARGVLARIESLSQKGFP